MRITIRDLVDLLDYDRTGARTVRIFDTDTHRADVVQTSSYLLDLIEDTVVDSIDTAGGYLTIFVNRESMRTQA